jgi:hypothetical protein
MSRITTTQPRPRRPVSVTTARKWLERFREPLLTVLLAVQIFILFIMPVHPIARALANVESICGQLFPATLLARIVGLHSLMHRPAAPGPGL